MNNINKYFYFIIVCFLLAGIQIVFAGETFQNNLLKADINKNSLGGIKVNLYTNKPYNDSAVVNKKSDFEYVILMPETSNSLTAKPTLQSVSDVVSNIEIKTQQYVNNVKGYTKIVISTTRPVEIIPQIHTLNSASMGLSEKDYKELLAQTPKKHLKQVKKEVKQIIATKKETTTLYRKSKQVFVQPLQQDLRTKAKQKIKSVQRTVETKTVAPRVISRPKIAERPSITTERPKTTVKKPKAISYPAPVSIQQPVTQKVSEMPGVGIPAVEEPKVESSIYTPIQQQNVQNVQNEVVTPVVNTAVVPVQKVGRLQKYKTIIKNNLYAVIGLGLGTFLLLLLMARRMTKNMHKRKENFISHLDDKPLPVKDYTENITEDMTWKEKFQTYVDLSAQSDEEPTSPVDTTGVQDFGEVNPIQTNEDIDELFSKEPLSAKIARENFIKDSEEDTVSDNFEEIVKSESMLGNLPEDLNIDDEASIDELFGDEEIFNIGENLAESPIGGYAQESTESYYGRPAQYASEISKPVEFVKSEFVIDDGKGFYLVDFEDTTALVGHIGEEFFVLKRFDKKIEDRLQARLDEKKSYSSNYMTKVGSFKAIVEVTPNDMNLLIEL